MSSKRIKPVLIEPSAALPDVLVQVQPIALSLEDAARIAGVPRWTVKENILTGSLKAKRAGRSNIVLLSELQKWIASLDDVPPSTAASFVARRDGVGQECHY